MRFSGLGRAGAVAAWCLCAAGAQAQSVAMTGSMGSKALLVVNGGAPKAVEVGQTYQGIKVLSVNADTTAFEVGGKRYAVHLGEAPVGIKGAGGGDANGTRIVLTASDGGHYRTAGAINGGAVNFMVDTGASLVVISRPDADRLGLKYQSEGQPGWVSTANGAAPAYHMVLNSVRVQDVEVYNVDAVITPQPMGQVLLGNSFLSRFKMIRDSDKLTLEKQY